MRATTEEIVLLNKLERYFDPSITPRIEPSQDFSAFEIQILLDSLNADLALAGLYVLSFMRRSVDFHVLARGERSSLNVAHYFFSLYDDTTAIKRLASVLGEESMTVKQAAFLSSKFPNSSLTAATAHVVAGTSKMTVIVHGTGARKSTWWRKGGTFFNHIDGITGDVYGASDQFYWSGANKHAKRLKAAKELKDWLAAHPSTFVRVIAHSHGGNVALAASRLGAHIDHLILLGTPVRLEYLPDLRNIVRADNIFATTDRIQKIGTFPNCRAEGRTFGDSTSMANLRATNDGNNNPPGHSDLHEPALWTVEGFDGLL